MPNNRLAVGALLIAVLSFVFNLYLLAQPLIPGPRLGATNLTDLVLSGDVTAASGTITTLTSTTHNVLGTGTFSLSPIFSSESITPANGATITPTKNVVTLTPAGAVGNALGTCATNTWMVLYNSTANNVVITDTGNALLAGNQTIGQDDALALICIGTKWVQVSAVSAN